MFVSLLSVNEFALTGGLSILGVATGTVVYPAGEQDTPENSQLMKSATRRKTQVLRAAYDRMEEQGRRMGASGVIGVRLLHQPLEQGLWEYTVQGTAVTRSAPRTKGHPFVCTLSVQEYFALAAAGYRPVGVALGICVYYQKFHQRVQQKIVESGQNVERSDFTRGIYTARRNALMALEAEAATMNAEGILAMEIKTERKLINLGRVSQGMRIEFTALGTAIVASGSDMPAIHYGLPLTG